jgi:hypothetical protein
MNEWTDEFMGKAPNNEKAASFAGFPDRQPLPLVQPLGL